MANELQIQAPRQGVAPSPHVGFAEVVNLDISSIPGIVKLSNSQALKSSTTVTDQINWFVRHPVTTTEVYALGNTGKVYKSTDSGATWSLMTGFTAGGHGNGLAIWKNYLFVARDAYLDVCGDGSATGITNSNWTNGWKAIDSDSLWHPMIVSKLDGKLYGGAANHIFTLDENTAPFAPATAGSYNWTQDHLDLPTGYRVKCLAELGNLLMIGTWQGTNVYDIRLADIFTWTGSAAVFGDVSANVFGQPVQINDYGVHAMYNEGNSLIVLAGTSGTIYKCDGVNAYKIGKIPTDLSGGKYIEFYPGALTGYKDKIFLGTGQGGTTAIGGQGVWSLEQTGRGNILALEHLNSSSTDGSAAPVKCSSLLPITRDTLLSGFRSDTAYGIDLSVATTYATGYTGYFTTAMYRVGTNKQPRKFTEMELSLVKPLRTGEGIKVEYRKDLTESFITIGTYDFANYGALLSKNIVTELPHDIKPCETIQIKCSLTGSGTSPELSLITLR